MSEMNGTAPLSAGYNMSLLKSLDIGDDELTDAISVSNSHHAAGNKAEFSAEFNIDFGETTVHELFQYTCSRNTSRIYVYDQVLVVA